MNPNSESPIGGIEPGSREDMGEDVDQEQGHDQPRPWEAKGGGADMNKPRERTRALQEEYDDERRKALEVKYSYITDSEERRQKIEAEIRSIRRR